MFYLDNREKEWELPNTAVTEQNPTPGDTAVMLFSEKESGNVTVIEISHSALMAQIYAMSDVLSFQPGDRILTLNFPDKGMLAIDILVSLFNGTEIVIPPEDFEESAQPLMAFLQSDGDHCSANPPIPVTNHNETDKTKGVSRKYPPHDSPR